MSVLMERKARANGKTMAPAVAMMLALIALGGSADVRGQSANADAMDGQASCVAADKAMVAGQWEAANDQYTKCIRSTPPKYETLSNMGTVQSHLGQMENAIKSYQQALALAPDNPKVEFNLAVTFIKAGNYNAAVDHLSKLRESAPDIRNEELLAFCYFHLGRYSLAARAGERVEAVQPGDPANALILGSAYSRLGQYDKALPLITLALKAAGSAEGHLIMGQTLLGLRQYHPAMEELSQASKLQPDLPGIHSALGIADVGLGDSEGAAAEFNKALNQDPHDYQANYYLGRLKRLDGDTEAAKKYLATANELRPGSAEVLFEVAAIAVTAHHYADAEPLLLKVIQQEPEHGEAHFLLAECYQKSGRSDAAKREREIFEKLRAQKNNQDPPAAGQNDGTATSSSAEKP
jgi:tetratricopeptide (TPR) repeat protein